MVRALAPLLCASLCAAGCSLGTFNEGALSCGPDDGGSVCPSGTACYCNTCWSSAPANCCVAAAPTGGGLTPRYGLALVYVQSGNYLLALGGFDSCGQPSSLIEAYDLSSNTVWLPSSSALGLTDLPTAAGSLGAAALGTGGALLAAGGQGPGGALLSTVEVNPLSPPDWELTANLPNGLSQPALAFNEADGCVYVVGGLLSLGSPAEQSSDIEQLCNPLTATSWNSVGSFSCDGTSACTVTGAAAVYSTFDENIYVLGGLSGQSALSSAAIVASGGVFSLMSAQTNAGHINGGAAFAGTSSLFVMGGLPAPGQPPTAVVETFDLSNSATGWVEIAPMPVALSDFGAASDDQGNVYVAGGRTPDAAGGSVAVGSMEVYANGIWSTVP